MGRPALQRFFRPCEACAECTTTRGLRPGLRSGAASRLGFARARAPEPPDVNIRNVPPVAKSATRGATRLEPKPAILAKRREKWGAQRCSGSFAPAGLAQNVPLPGAYAPGCILAPLRGWAALSHWLRSTRSDVKQPPYATACLPARCAAGRCTGEGARASTRKHP